MDNNNFFLDLIKKVDDSFSSQYIGIAGAGRSGKDTLAAALVEILTKKGFAAQSHALAEPLKNKMRAFLLESFGIDVLSCNDDEKKLIRPLLVEWGRVKRIQTSGTYFTTLLENKINDLEKSSECHIISDIRYADYEGTDELFWLKDKMDGTLIFVERILPSGELVPPANEDERRNNIILKQNADLVITWETFPALSPHALTSHASKYIWSNSL